MNQKLRTEPACGESTHIEPRSKMHERLPEIGVSTSTARQVAQSSIGDNYQGQKQSLIRSSIAQYEDESYSRRMKKMNINSQTEQSPMLSPQQAAATNQMKKFKAE